MRILLIGQAAFAADVLQGLEKAGDTVAAVVCPPDKGPKPDPVKAAALVRNIPVHQFSSLKQPEARAAFEAASADLGVLAYVTQIVPESLLAIPRHTSICFHPSLLPRYRGGSAINWQLINGEALSGVTVFWPDAGIDTGPIIVQRTAPIGADDSAGSLYYQTLYPLGVQTTLDAVAMVRAGTAPRVVQDAAQGTYDPLCRDEHARIDWAQSTQRVHDRIRGCDPAPGAHAGWRGGRLRFFDSRRVMPAAGSVPGTVVAIDADGITVATTDGAVRCARLRGDGLKAAAAEIAPALGLTPGARLDV